ncbi:DUF6868 family protein [Zobellella sp. DQSA1]|uniref:DUF6868 family protein n=1 Tax=Zobellella sp. DQSA1 TaxID=3342386 RepID=UPI0035BEE958
MEMDAVQDFLLWCLGINYGILLIWFMVFCFAREWMHRLHGRWFRLAPGQFDALHYAAMAAYKIGILLFNLVPWLALKMVF